MGAGGAFFGEDGDQDVRATLSSELGRVTRPATFTVAEFSVGAATIFQVSRDGHGTPNARKWEYHYENGVLADGHESDPWSEAMTDPDLFYRQVAPKLIVRRPDRLPDGLYRLISGPVAVPVHSCRTRLGDLLRGVLKDSPLVLGYELAGLKHVRASRTRPEGLVFTGHPLFSPGQARGARYRVPVMVEPTGDEGTVFAVVTREPRPNLPRRDWPLRPMQVQVARVPPGRYELTAELVRPGKVRLEGLPAQSPLGHCDRSWDELRRLVPRQLMGPPAPVHLICLVEVCGSDEVLQQRIDRLEDLINEARAGGLPLHVSVVAYGAHGVAWSVDDLPPDIRVRAVPPDQAIKALRGLVGRQPDDREYPRAAQLECAVRLVRELLPRGGRPVIVTAGGRPAHPPRLDTSRQIIPCPNWVDGAAELDSLLGIPRISFGALRDPKCRGMIWGLLGRHAGATIDDAVDMEGFTANLGLRAVMQTVPFPVIE
jgi:hypothetical protein